MPEVKWVKFTTDMFEDEKIKLIEKMPEADGLIVIWAKMICQAGKVNDGGLIYLSPEMPYNDEDLATIFNRPVNVIRLAINTFKRLGMIEIQENGHIFLLNFEKHQNIDALDRIRETTRKRVANYRDKQKLLTSGNVTVTFGNATDKIRVDKIREEVEEESSLLKKLLEEKRYDEIIINGQRLSTILRCFSGEQPCSKQNLELYRRELGKLGIADILPPT
jgi:predicted phage replisome organizer